MNINKIKKKYPYKEAKATIIEIIHCRPKEGFVIDYDKDDAIYDLRCDEERYGFSSRRFDDYSDYEIYDKVSRHADHHGGFAIIDEDFNGNPVSKVFEYWYEQKLLIEYNDIQGNKHCGSIEISSKKEYKSGDRVDICYLIDNPDEVSTKDSGYKTVEDYMEKQHFIILLIVFFLLFFISIMVVYCIKN